MIDGNAVRRKGLASKWPENWQDKTKKTLKNDLTRKVQDCIIKKEKDIRFSLATTDIFIRISNSGLLYQRKNN